MKKTFAQQNRAKNWITNILNRSKWKILSKRKRIVSHFQNHWKKIHNVFHFSFFEFYKTISDREKTHAFFIEIENEKHWKIENIFDNRLYYRKFQYLIKWMNYFDTNNQWLFATKMLQAKKLTSAFHVKYSKLFFNNGRFAKRQKINS